MFPGGKGGRCCHCRPLSRVSLQYFLEVFCKNSPYNVEEVTFEAVIYMLQEDDSRRQWSVMLRNNILWREGHVWSAVTSYFTDESHCVLWTWVHGVTGIFYWHNPSGRTMALGLTQPLTEMSTRNVSWGLRRPVRRVHKLTTFMCRLSWNLGASASWKPQGLSRPVMGLLYLYLYLLPT